MRSCPWLTVFQWIYSFEALLVAFVRLVYRACCDRPVDV